jgi:hypothetical protein
MQFWETHDMHTSSPRLIALCSPAMGSGKSVVAGELVDNHGFLLIKFAGTLKRMIARLLSETGYDPTQVADMVDGRDKEKPIPYFDVVFRGQPIARIIDAMLLELFNDLAIPKAVVEDLMADLRDEPIEGLGVTTNLLRCALNKWFVDCILFRQIITPRWLQQSLGTEWGRDLILPNLWITIAKLKVRAHQAMGRDIVIDDMRFINEYDTVLELGGEPVRVNRPGVERTTPPHPSEGALDQIDMLTLQNGGTVADLQQLAGELVSAPVESIARA